MEVLKTQREAENKKIFISLFVPVMFVALLNIVMILKWAFDIPAYTFGILPREPIGLIGVLAAPLLHANWGHLYSNAWPLVLLGAAMIYFYRRIAYSVFVWVWLLDGIGVWLLGRQVYHIGASGVVYGMASFVFFSGVLRKNRNLLSLALAVIVMYGGLIWGIYPLENGVSWEAHLFGLLSGIFCAIYYKPYGPANDPVPEWMTREEEELEDESLPHVTTNNENVAPPMTIIYTYKEEEKKANGT